MIIIPEIETVLLLTPRTGSGSLKRAVAATYPKSMLLYRHMEADGVPAGYDRWRRIGFVRNPIDRLWSLYKFLGGFDGDHDQAYIDSMRASVARSFDDWIVNNQVVFTSPYDSAGLGRFFPQYTVRHPLPENRKSQFVYLRPDLGTTVFGYTDIGLVAESLGLSLGRQNQTGDPPRPALSQAAAEHCERFFAWDFQVLAQLRYSRPPLPRLPKSKVFA